MSDPTTNRALNDVLILLNRSLLQYVGESWPYTAEDEQAIGETVAAAVASQRASVQRLTDLLAERTWPIDFGTYPTAYTDLHFVALDYLLPQVVENERALIGDVENSVAACAGDAAASGLLKEALAEQRELVGKLDAEAKQRAAA